MKQLNESFDFKPLLNLKGLEIAGPSGIFQAKGLMPIYPLLSSLDDYSFPRPLAWGGRELNLKAEYRYPGGQASGRQFVGDATTLDGVADGSYEIVIGSHVLEHFSNPLKAMSSWIAALVPEGLILQVIPHGEATFDRRRPVTTLAHLIDDWDRDTPNDDRSHYEEVRALSDESHSEVWFADAHLHRGLHHHVFDTKLAVEMFKHMGLNILGLAPLKPHHIVIMGQLGERSCPLSDEVVLKILAQSPFQRDRELAKATTA